MPENIFVLGVGAQKSGTTWLHDYLASFDEVDFGQCKEYHVWDGLREKNSRWRARRKRNKSAKTPAAIRRDQLRYLMQTVDSFYESYFASLMSDTVRITGDITPNYSILQVRDYRKIKRRLEKKGFRVKVIFLMRDPYERAYSSVRMRIRQRIAAGRLSVPTEEGYLEATYDRDMVQSKTSYRQVIRKIETVFPPEDTLFAIYETFISPEGAQRLSEMLGIGVKLDRFDRRLNVSEKTSEISEDLQARVRESFRSTYEYCYKRFPETKDVWHTLDRSDPR